MARWYLIVWYGGVGVAMLVAGLMTLVQGGGWIGVLPLAIAAYLFFRAHRAYQANRVILIDIAGREIGRSEPKKRAP
jgi:4-hydroxybenzoate polyprenyltransferase